MEKIRQQIIQKAVVQVNKCYSKMCAIGRSDFPAEREDRLTKSSTKCGFLKAIKAINDVYKNYRDARKIELPKTSGIPKIINNSNLTQPKRR